MFKCQRYLVPNKIQAQMILIQYLMTDLPLIQTHESFSLVQFNYCNICTVGIGFGTQIPI